MSEKARLAFGRLMRRLTPKEQRALLAYIRKSDDAALIPAKPEKKNTRKSPSKSASALDALDAAFADVEARPRDKIDLLLEALESQHGAISLDAKHWPAAVRALEKQLGEAALKTAATWIARKLAPYARNRDIIT